MTLRYGGTEVWTVPPGVLVGFGNTTVPLEWLKSGYHLLASVDRRGKAVWIKIVQYPSDNPPRPPGGSGERKEGPVPILR